MKDNFSLQAAQYATYRPAYPEELYQFVINHCKHRGNVWDCGTGNGQAADRLSLYFDKVYATDISQSQLEHAQRNNKIEYSLQSAERTNFHDNLFDLVFAVQAVHWFDFEKFYNEVRRTLTPNGIIALAGYGLPKISVEIDRIIADFYRNILGNYWDAERRFVDEKYQTIPFPFIEIETPDFQSSYDWNLEHFTGYLETWSALQHFKLINGFNPLNEISNALKTVWKENQTKKITFPIFMRLGRL